MEGNPSGESLVPRKRTLSRDSDDETEAASPKRTRIDHQGLSEPPSPNDVKTDHRGPRESPIPDDARADRQGTIDRPSLSEAKSDHPDPNELPTLGEARDDHQDSRDLPGTTERGNEHRGPRESSPTGAVDRPNPDEARIELQGPGWQQLPVEAGIARQRTEEEHFYSLYKAVLDLIKEEESITDEEVTSGIDTVHDAFRHWLGHTFRDIDFTDYRNVCGYLFRGGVQGAGLARCRVLEAARHCEELSRKLTCPEEGTGRDLRVVSVGGGPGNDAFGFCSALAELGFPEDRALLITVVDAIPVWEECVARVNNLLRNGHFGQASELFGRDRMTMGYVTASLPFYGDDAHDFIANADILLLQKVLSTLELYTVPKVMRYIHSTMKDEAFVILIDVCLKEKEGRLVYHNKHEEFENFVGFDLLHLSQDGDGYSLLEPHARFGRSDDIPSTARIAVLSKTSHG